MSLTKEEAEALIPGFELGRVLNQGTVELESQLANLDLPGFRPSWTAHFTIWDDCYKAGITSP